MGVKIVDTYFACQQAIDDFKSHYEEFPVLGFSCELIPSSTTRKQAALMCLAAIDGECILIRLSMLDYYIPRNLMLLLENEKILKVGIFPVSAKKVLNGILDGATLGATLDLRCFARKFAPNPGGLEDLAKKYLDVTLDKDWRNRATNWEDICLPSYEVECATRDSQVAASIFKKLVSLLRPNDWPTIFRYCEQFIDRRYSE